MNEIAEFLKICEYANFRLREELLTELNSGQTTFHPPTLDDANLLSAKHYLEIYQRRAKHIQKFTTEHGDRKSVV